MKNKKAIENLKTNLDPYLDLWEEWTMDERCNLSREEIYVINVHMKNEFETRFFEIFMFYNKTEVLEKINGKLKSGYVLFKDWVIFKFLCKIIALAKGDGRENSLTLQIEDLEIPARIKINLRNFKVRSIRDIAHNYTVEELGSEPAFKNVLEFHYFFKRQEGLKKKNNSNKRLNQFQK